MDMNAVLCPCCNGVMYKEASMLDQNASVLGAIDRPKVEDGHMTCPRCQRKIKVERSLGSASGWKPAPKEWQDCS
jgi:hypothetical protein